MHYRIAMILSAAFCAAVLGTAGCGSSGGRNAPDTPNAEVAFESFLVDVGQRHFMDGSASEDPTGKGLEYLWTKISATSQSDFDDHCEDFPDVVCFSNDDDQCSVDDPVVFCQSNDDCTASDNDFCITNSGTTSPDCPEGICLLDNSRNREIASFVADVPGPYTIRLLAETDQGGTDVQQLQLSTYPSLMLLGSLYAFGGTEGGLIAEFADAQTFAPNAVAGVSSPLTGNILLAVTAGTIREFDYRDGSIVGTFGEAGSVGISPVAMAFDAGGDLYVASTDGTVSIFDGGTGLAIGVFGDVTAGTESVVAIGFAPSNGNLLVVDGQAGEAVREYGINSGSLRGDFGDTAGAAARAVDIAFLGDPPTDMYIADGAGDLIRCDANGTGCVVMPAAATLLPVNGPTAVAANPAGAGVDAAVLVTDSVNQRVIDCNVDGSVCGVFGDTVALPSAYRDVFFAPPDVPTTTTTTTSTMTSTTTTTTLGS